MLTYKGLRFGDVGVTKRKRSLLWTDVAYVVTAVGDGQFGKYYETTISPADDRQISIRCQKRLSSFSILPVYSEVLHFILSHLPEDVPCEKTRFVAKWGSDTSVTKKAERAVKQDRYGNETAVKALANHYWVRFDYSKARKLFQQALEINPDDIESLEALVLMDIETQERTHAVIARYEHLLTLVPNSERYLRMLALLLLESDNERGEDYAGRLLNMRPNDVVTGNALSGYYLRKGAFSEARTVVEQLKDVTDNAKVKEFAKEGLDYIDRYETDGRFRKKEKTRRSLRKMWWFVGAIVVPLLGLLFWLYSIVREILSDRGAP